jgi:preprotein translocase subunit SecF
MATENKDNKTNKVSLSQSWQLVAILGVFIGAVLGICVGSMGVAIDFVGGATVTCQHESNGYEIKTLLTDRADINSGPRTRLEIRKNGSIVYEATPAPNWKQMCNQDVVISGNRVEIGEVLVSNDGGVSFVSTVELPVE